MVIQPFKKKQSPQNVDATGQEHLTPTVTPVAFNHYAIQNITITAFTSLMLSSCRLFVFQQHIQSQMNNTTVIRDTENILANTQFSKIVVYHYTH